MTSVFKGHHFTVISGGNWASFFAKYLKTSLGLRRSIDFGSKSTASLVRQLVLFSLSSEAPLPLGSSAAAADFLFTIFEVDWRLIKVAEVKKRKENEKARA